MAVHDHDERSSLQRLLSLDKSFDTLDQRIEEAARILSLPLDAQSGKVESSVSLRAGHTARLEFVLRWLLEKLKTQAAARQSTQPWILLRLVLQSLPPSSLARSLSASQIVNVFTQALADAFPTVGPSVTQTASNTLQTSKKRKRHNLAEPPSDNPLTVFSEISASLHVLLARSAPSTSAPDAATENHMQAALRLDHSDIVRFVKQWLLSNLTLLSLQPRSISLVLSSMENIQHFLILQPVTTTDSSDIAFCTECLWPAALLIRGLHSAFDQGNSFYSEIQLATQVLERLIAHRVFVPARAAFYSAKNASKKPSKTPSPTLGERLAPVKSEIATLSSSAHLEPTQQTLLAAARDCMPLLLDLAVRCSPTSTPKQRMSEAPWIACVFTNLSDTIGSSDALESGLFQPEQVNQKINEMLDVLLKRNITLSSDLLSRLLDQNCRLSLSETDSVNKPDFALIAKILAMDSGIFTDINARNTQLLFDALSKYGKAPFYDQSESAPADVWPNPRAMCHQIAIPLLQAYARTRNLAVFLDRWFLSLKAQPSAEDKEWCLWTDASLEDSLRSVLETSLTPTQIAELLETRRTTLAETPFASTVLLNAIVGALKTDGTIAAVLPNLESLISTIEDSFSHASPDNSQAAHMISLLSQLYQVWYPIWSTSHQNQEVMAKSAAMLEAPTTRYALSDLQRAHRKQQRSSRQADSAFAFIACVCDMQRRLPNHHEEYARTFRQAALSLQEGDISQSYAMQCPSSFLAVMAKLPSLLSCIPSADRSDIFGRLFEELSNNKSLPPLLLSNFLDAFFAIGDFSVKDDFFTAACSSLEGVTSFDLVLNILLQWPLKGFSRQQREKVLDAITSSSLSQDIAGENKQKVLDLTATLLEVPNATARIAQDPSIIWSLAQKNYTLPELNAFESICTHLLKHILDTKEQDRSKAYISGLSKLVAKFMSKDKDLSLSSAPGKARLATTFFNATEARLEEAVLSDLPHRSPDAVDSFVKRLHEHISILPEINLQKGDEISEKILEAAEVYASTPSSLVACGGSSTKKYTKRLGKHLSAFLNAANASGVVRDDASLKALIQCFEQLSSAILDDSPLELCLAAERLIGQDLDAKQHHAVTEAVAKSIRALPDSERITLVDRLIPATELQCTAERVVLVRCIISSLQVRPKDETSAEAAFVLVRVLKILENCSDYNAHRQLAACVIALLRDQPNIVTQYSAELTVAVTTTLASPSSPLRNTKQASSIFESLCGIAQSLLQFHRSSLGGRFHVLIPLMQRLLACLFLPGSRDSGTANRFKHPPWFDSATHSLSFRHAQRYSRLLENLCNPPQSNVTSSRGKTNKSTPNLVDETRKARMHVAQHAPHILHYFCTLILHGRLGEGMRDALMPGMWTVIEVTEMGVDETRGVKALSASMGNAERAVLRGIWEDWRRFGGAWRG